MKIASVNASGERQTIPNSGIRLVVIAITLGLAFYLAQSPRLEYLMLPVLAIGVILLLRYPLLGLIGLIVSALVVPFSIGTGTQTGLHLAFIGVPVLWALWLLRQLYYRKPLLEAPRGIAVLLIGLMVTAGISFLSGQVPWVPFASRFAPMRAQIGALAVFVFSAALTLLVATQVNNIRWLRLLTYVFLGLGAIYVLGRLLGLGQLQKLIMAGATGSMLYAWLVVLAGGQALFNNDLKRSHRLILAGVAILTLYISLVGGARSWASGWAPALLGLAVLVVLRWPRLSIVMGAVGSVIAVVNYQFFISWLLADDNAYSLLTRRAAFEILVKVIEANPLLGVGPANYYYYTPLYSILGWYVRFNSHNQYLDIVAQIGLVGLVFFIGFAIAVASLGWQLRSKFTADGFANGYVNACLAGLAATMFAGVLGDWVLPFVYNIGINGFRASMFPWLFLGGMIALSRFATPSSKDASKA